jgi:hypothetical protein
MFRGMNSPAPRQSRASLDNDCEFTFGLHGNNETGLLGKEKIAFGLKRTVDL